MKRFKKQRSVVPVYLIALFWAFGGFVVRIHRPAQFIGWAVGSIALFCIGRMIWKDREIIVEEPEEQAQPEVEEDEDKEIRALRVERDYAINEMRRLNDNIKDVVISQQIDRIEYTTGRIFGYVLEHPEKKSQIRRFLNYYLPTTIKLLNSYDRLDNVGISGTNIDGAMGHIEELMRTVVQAFERQLDALYQGEAMDINAEIQVLESMLHGDGLSGQSVASH